MKVYHHVHKIWLLNLVAKHKNFKQAAAESGLTQSALSQNLSNLEKSLGKTLVIRERGKVEMTPLGQEMVSKSEKILDQLDELSHLVQEEEFKGTIRLGAYESLAITLIPELLKTMEVNYPNLKLELFTDRSSELIKDVRAGKLDMALVITDETTNQLVEDAIAPQYLGLYVSQNVFDNHPWEDFLAQKGLATMSPSSSGHFQFYHQFLKQIKFPYKITMSTGSFETIKSVTLNDCCVGLLPYLLAEHEKDLVRVWPQNNTLGKHSIKLISRESSNHDFRRYLVEHLGNILNTRSEQ
jgi:DNA-binding transcriptional LysR family regulator